MKLFIKRTYHAQGTNGVLTINGEVRPFCNTIELPWRDNKKQISCIPAGTYLLEKRYSLKFKWHLHLKDVPGREGILIHPANNACIELEGCIAPVTIATGPGTGLASKPAFNRLIDRVFEALQRREHVLLTILPHPAGPG